MKRASLVLALGICASLMACSSEDTTEGDPPENTNVCPACVTTPDAVAADDERPTGVYKGLVFRESVSGTVKATIATDQSTGTCQVKVGSETHDSSEFVAGPPEAVGTTNTFSGDHFTLVLVLDDVGEVVSVDLTLAGSSMGASVVKEHSTVLVECFEGTWTESQGDQGMWTAAIIGSLSVGSGQGPDHQWYPNTGTVDGLQLTLDNPPGYSWEGTLSEDRMTMSGSWSWPDAHGTTEGHRTL